jgi:hypothetical protein
MDTLMNNIHVYINLDKSSIPLSHNNFNKILSNNKIIQYKCCKKIKKYYHCYNLILINLTR